VSAAVTARSPAAGSSVRSAAIGLACAISSGLLFSVSTVSASKALDEGLPVSLVTGARLAIGCLLLWGVSLLTGRQRISVRTRLLLMAVGVLTAVQVYFLYQSVERISASLAVLLLYSYPPLVALLSATFLHERLGKVKLAAVATSLAGTLLIVGLPAGQVTLAGCLFGLGAGLGLAIYIVLASRVAAGVDTLTATSWLQLGATIVFLPVLATLSWSSPRLSGAGWEVVVGLASGLAATLFLAGVQRLTPTVASIASTAEPISTAALAAVLLGVTLTGIQLAGGLLIVMALLIISLAGVRQPARRPLLTETPLPRSPGSSGQ
jgi:drug/metabolite transporter (DMT)-like permease